MPSPIVSVIMPVYNAEKYVGEALASLVRQTFDNFEILVVDDGSTDSSIKVVEGSDDPRVRIVRHSRNCGLAAARNTGLVAARGAYIAWLDADDVCHPSRILDQVKYLESNADLAMCGTWIKTFGRNAGEQWRYPTDDSTVRATMLFNCAFATSSVMLRRNVLSNNDVWFDASFPLAEDYDLWERLLRIARAGNIPRSYVSYRLHIGQTSANAIMRMRLGKWRVQERQLRRLGLLPSAQEQDIHTRLGFHQYAEDDQFIERAKSWLERLAEANRATAVYPSAAFEYVLFTKLVGVCGGARKKPAYALKLLSSSPLAQRVRLTDKHRIHLLARCLFGPFVRPLMRWIRPDRVHASDAATEDVKN